jgi:hypothetical protein
MSSEEGSTGLGVQAKPDTPAKCNKATLVLVPGHRGIAGIADDEKADALERKRSAKTFTRPEPVFGITKAIARRSISEWIKLQHQTYWTNMVGHRQGKLMVGKPSQSLAADALRLSRTQIRVITGLMMGHCNLRKHLHTMANFKENPVCRLCNEK